MLRTICLLAVVLLAWTAAPAAQAHEVHHHAAATQQAEAPAAVDEIFIASIPADRGVADACVLSCCAGIACASCCAVIAAASELAFPPLAAYAALALPPLHLGRGLPPATPPPRTLG